MPITILLSAAVAAATAFAPLLAPPVRAAAPASPQSTCDFDGNGYNDLAIGVPGEDGRGAVNIQRHDGNFVHLPSIVRPPSDVEGGADFGASLACGDFDHDGIDDLAIGAPKAPPGGRVYIHWGHPQRPLVRYVWFSQNNSHIPGVAHPFDRFGFALARGDFDANGRDDLAVGIPNDTDPDGDSGDRHGSVAVIYGSAAGWSSGPLGPVSLLTGWHRVHPAETVGQGFGWALAAAPLVSGQGDDLAVGAPFTDVVANGGNRNCSFHCLFDAGRVYLLRSQADDLVPYTIVDADDFATPGSRDSGYFGASLATGDFDGDGRTGLAIGAPGQDVPGADAAGLVFVARGSPSGPIPEYQGVLDAQAAGGAMESGDWFGTSLAAGDFDVDGIDDLAVGTPGEDVGSGRHRVVDAGAVFVVYGSGSPRHYWAGHRVLVQGKHSIPGVSEPYDHFGASLGVVSLLSYDDLLIGTPGEGGLSAGQPNLDNAGQATIVIGYPHHGPIGDPALTMNQDTGAPYHVSSAREFSPRDAPEFIVTFGGSGEWFGWSFGQ